ncbi:radical SAM protein [Kitasatospora sp. NPDC094011]|uniref:radical SAM protein n=1 Tax=Kitasatospora sp. NPDC094011 TaxID=3364090 RepID=UPI00381FE584
MISDAITCSTSDALHVSFADGYVFHVRGGQITAPNQPCPCGDLEPVHQITAYREAYPQAQLSLTDTCNMGCSYCSFRDRVHADGKPVTIPLETVMQGLATHRKRLVEEDARYSRVDFGLAGETMLVRHMHDQVHAMVEEGLADSPVSVVWAGPMVTNATLSMTPELADKLGPPQDISLDGPKDVHDRVRFYTNGRGGTYDHVRSVLDRVLARHPDMGVSAVLTAYCTDFTAIFRHLFEDVGARNIYMKPVNATYDKEYALNAKTLPRFRQGYSDLVEHILAQPPEGILARLLALNSEDFFMRFFYRVKDRAAQVYRCGAGKSGT